jgi:SAM-dependent methyltransferase
VSSHEEHAFTDVDAQDDPSAWIDVLDRVRAEPAYAAYKERVAELLRPVAGGRYLELGTGTGADARALQDRHRVEVTGVDSATTMVEEARRRGVREALVADAHALPFDDATFDGAWADRVFQHLERPEAALAEMIRVVRPGGRIVVADPDYDTQVVDVEDRELARRVLDFRSGYMLRHGALAHRMGGIFRRADLVDVTVEAASIALRDPAALDNAMGLRTWAATARERGVLSAEDAAAWEREIDASIAEGRFLYAFTIFVTAGGRRLADPCPA